MIWTQKNRFLIAGHFSIECFSDASYLLRVKGLISITTNDLEEAKRLAEWIERAESENRIEAEKKAI